MGGISSTLSTTENYPGFAVYLYSKPYLLIDVESFVLTEEILSKDSCRVQDGCSKADKYLQLEHILNAK